MKSAPSHGGVAKSPLPANAVNYAETAVFTEETVPAKLTRDHDTKPGVWGRIIVLDGALDYIIPGPPERKQRLSPGRDGIVRPTEPHRVAPVGAVRFKVAFYARQAQLP